MKILAGILFLVCAGVMSSSAEKAGKDNTLQEIWLRSQHSVNDDVNKDIMMKDYDVSDLIELLDSTEIGDLMHIDEVSDLMNIDDAVNFMNKDELERLRVAIHSKSYCHCHYNHCECCRTVYLFWKIPIFKACIGLYYEGRDFIMRLKVYGITLVKHKLPLGHQKPVCARVLGAYNLCAELYGVKIHNGVVHACLKITKPVEMDLKCFTLHSPSDPEDGGKELAFESDPGVQDAKEDGNVDVN